MACCAGPGGVKYLTGPTGGWGFLSAALLFAELAIRKLRIVKTFNSFMSRTQAEMVSLTYVIMARTFPNCD